MGAKVGRISKGDTTRISGSTVAELFELVSRGGKNKQKAITELTKRKVALSEWPVI